MSNEQNKEILTKILEELLNTFKDVKTFAGDQVPLIAQDIIKSQIVEAVLTPLLFVVLIVFAFIASKSFKKNYEQDKKECCESFPTYISAVATGVLFIGAFIVLFGSAVEIKKGAQAYYAPRAFLIEWASEKLK